MRRKFRLELAGDCLRDLGLDRERVREIAVVMLGPLVFVRAGIDQLRGDADAIFRPLHAAFEKMSDAKLLANFARVSGRACFVNHHRRPADDLQVRDLRQAGKDFVVNPIGEKPVLFFRAQVTERKNGDRFFRRGLIRGQRGRRIRLGI